MFAFLWSKLEQKNLQEVLKNVKAALDKYQGIAKVIIVLEALLFFISLYLSVYATLSIFSVASGLSIIISAVAMLPMLFLYVSYLQKNDIVVIYKKVYSASTDSNHKKSKTNDPRIPVAVQVVFLLLLLGLIVFSFLSPAIFASIISVVAGSFDLMLARAALGVFFLLILIYANTPNNEIVAGLLFGGLSLITAIMVGIALVSFFASQGFVLSAAASFVVYFFIGLVAGFYSGLSYDFNCKYDYCYYTPQESQDRAVSVTSGLTQVSSLQGLEKLADIHDSELDAGDDLVGGSSSPNNGR